MKTQRTSLYLVCLFFTTLIGCGQSASDLDWPEINRQTKPWTRWWWHGSSVNKQDLTASMEAYQKNGIGGLEITPIYGVIGNEDQFFDYLSPKWIEMLDHTLREGQRLDLGIDMATGTGWPFGGPQVTSDDAPKNVIYRTYKLQSGESLNENITYRQQPLVRAVRNQIDISELIEPVSANKKLQALALDQVKFEKQLPLQVLMAYSDAGETLNLTEKVVYNGVFYIKVK